MQIHHHTRPVTTRATRVSVVSAEAQLSDVPVELMDVSLTGALVVTEIEVQVGSRHRLCIGSGLHAIDLDARVVRVRPAPYTQPPRWDIAVTFVDLSPQARRAIPTIVSKMSTAIDPDGQRRNGGKRS